MPLELAIILALTLVNGVFAGAEIAVISVRKTRLTGLLEEGRTGAKALHALRQMPERFLATVQVGITVIGATTAAFGGSTIAAGLTRALADVPLIGDYARQIALASVIALVSFLSLVLGELVPKSLALRVSERYALAIAPPLLLLAHLARPLAWLLTGSSNAVLRLFHDKTSFTEARLSPEELQQMLDEATKVGSVDADAGHIATRALAFGEISVEEVMVPRPRVIAVARNVDADELRRLAIASGHSRIPVYEGSIDRVCGYVLVRDVLARCVNGEKMDLDELMHPAYHVPETKLAVDLLREMQARHLHMAMVVEETGGLAGIVTIEDLVEEVVGDIFSEDEEAAVAQRIQRQADGSFLVPGGAAVRDINRELGFTLPEDGDWNTIAGLCSALAGRIPDVGTRLEPGGGIEIEVVDASPRRVRAVRLRFTTAPTPAKEAS